MNPDRWRHVEQLFQSALERPADERAAFLSQACAGNSELRQELESLLQRSSGTSLLDRPALDRTGMTLGPYRIVERIGSGGMGEVFRALDTRLNRTVAIKLLHAHLADRPDFRHRFEREARTCSALNHPHICGLYDIGTQDGVSYLVMEYVEGETVAACLGKGPLPLEHVVQYGTQIAGALAAAHALGIVHRDLKPANLILTRSGIKILDFGLAKFEQPQSGEGEAMETVTAQTAVIGTLAYMAPEQLEGKTIDARTDIFALGLVLHEMATATRAFAADSQAGLIAEILRGEPATLHGVPPHFAHIVRRCLMRDPSRRWQAVSDVGLELHECLSVPAPAPAVVRQPRRWWPGALWAASILAAVGLGAALVDDPHSVNLSDYRLTPFATARNYQASPLWSPDGKSIAFVGQEAGRRSLLIQSLDSPVPLNVTGPEVDVSPFFPGFWSPDSRSVYFTATRSGQTAIFRVPAGGGEAALIQPNALRGTISPDGRTLAMLAQSGDGFHIWFASPPESARSLYQPAPFDAGQWKGRPAISFAPDGKKILIVVDTDRRREAWLLPWPAGKGRRVFEVSLFGPAPQFTWMPDSRQVVTSAVDRGQPQLYMADTESGRSWRILAQDRPIALATVSPDGARLAYQSSLSTAEVVAAPLRGAPTRTLLGGSRSQQMAAHSATAQQLVYVTDRRGVAEVWITSLSDGWDRLLLAPGDIRIGSEAAVGFATPVFSRDGRRVAVVANSPTGAAIFTTPSSGTMPVRVTAEANPSEYGPTWSPDGNWLAFWHIVGAETRLAKVRPGAGDAPVDLADCWNRTVPAWSPTGEWIAYHDRASQLALVSADGKQRRKLGGAGAVAWASDGKILYQARSDTRRLVAIDAATGKESDVRDLGELAPYSSVNAGWRASLTSDGTEFVYTVNRPREEIWILDGIRVPRPWYRRLLPSVRTASSARTGMSAAAPAR